MYNVAVIKQQPTDMHQLLAEQCSNVVLCKHFCVGFPIPGSRIPGLSTSKSRDFGIEKLLENRSFSVIKWPICYIKWQVGCYYLFLNYDPPHFRPDMSNLWTPSSRRWRYSTVQGSEARVRSQHTSTWWQFHRHRLKPKGHFLQLKRSQLMCAQLTRCVSSRLLFAW